MTTKKTLEGKGEWDYDSDNDILFFRIKDREYQHSIEFEDIVVDLDNENYITGIQMFGASKMFGADKEALQSINHWTFDAKADGKIIQVRIVFELEQNNKHVKNTQNFVRETQANIGTSHATCIG